MRLSDFIRASIEPILAEWDSFARTLVPAREVSREGVPDYVREILLGIADDLDSPESPSGQLTGSEQEENGSDQMSWGQMHGAERKACGFSLDEMMSEFQAMRTTVVSGWARAKPVIADQDLDDLSRFHEAIDRAVRESLQQYTALKEMETRLFGAVLRASPDPIYVLDPDGRFVYANKAAADLLGLPIEALIGRCAFHLGFPFVLEFQQNLQRVITRQSSYRGELSHNFSSGEGECFEYELAPVLDEQGRTEAALCITRDITERARAEEREWYKAHYDLLTGLPNRRLFLERLDQELKHAKRRIMPVAVLFLDLDGFKPINDSVGHEAGDRLLHCVAKRLIRCVRENDTAARLGGDEFTFILTGVKQRQDVERVAQSIINVLTLPFNIDGKQVHISVSIGAALFPQNASSPGALLRAADLAMYQSKGSATNRVSFYEGLEQDAKTAN